MAMAPRRKAARLAKQGLFSKAYSQATKAAASVYGRAKNTVLTALPTMRKRIIAGTLLAATPAAYGGYLIARRRRRKTNK
jgi:hypothetical protein